MQSKKKSPVHQVALSGLEVFDVALNAVLADAGVPAHITQGGEGDPGDLPEHLLEEFGLDHLMALVEFHTILKGGVSTRSDYFELVEAYEEVPDASRLAGFPHLDYLKFEKGQRALPTLMDSYASKFDV